MLSARIQCSKAVLRLSGGLDGRKGCGEGQTTASVMKASCFKLLKEKRGIVTFIAGDMNANSKSKTESIQIHDFYLPDPS